MKRFIQIGLVFLLAAGAAVALILAYAAMRKEREAEAARETPVIGKSRAEIGPAGETMVTLDQETQKRISLKVEPVREAKLSPQLKAYGRVLDPAPLAALAAELASAEAANTVSQKEFDRLKRLTKEQNISERAFQAAEAVARQSQLRSDSIRTRLLLEWGKTIAEQSDLSTFVQSLASAQTAVVRVDLPGAEILGEPPIRARLVLSPAHTNSTAAQLLGIAPTVDPQMQGQGFLFLANAPSWQLLPGKAVTAYLLSAGSTNGVLVPDSAVVRHAEQGWVYVQTSDTTFARRRISLDYFTENGWFVTSGIERTGRLVVSGAQALFSEEQKHRIKLLE